jgi:hypothetical protein
VFGRLAAVVAVFASVVTAYFLASYAAGGLHLPALLAAVVLAIASAALMVCGLLADGICANRRLTEDALARIKRIEAAGIPVMSRPQAASLDVVRGEGARGEHTLVRS